MLKLKYILEKRKIALITANFEFENTNLKLEIAEYKTKYIEEKSKSYGLKQSEQIYQKNFLLLVTMMRWKNMGLIVQICVLEWSLKM